MENSGGVDIVNKKRGTLLTVDSTAARIIMIGCQNDDESESSSDEDANNQMGETNSDHEESTKLSSNDQSCGVNLRNASETNGVDENEDVFKNDPGNGEEVVRRTRSRPVSNEDENLAQSIIINRESLRSREIEFDNSDDENSKPQSTVLDDIAGRSPRTKLLSEGEVQLAVEKNWRFNPFNKESNDSPDVFENSDAISFSSDISRNTSTSGLSEMDEEVVIRDDYFAIPEGHLSEKSIPDLKLSIIRLKENIMNLPEKTAERRSMVKKLVNLRMKLTELKEAPLEDSDAKPILGHKFTKRASRSSKHYCEKCNTVIWGMLQTWYRCTECGYTSHNKCLNHTLRPCASAKVLESPSYILTICPEQGLSAQKYKCHECRKPLSYNQSYGEPRLCDYTGRWYCELCHWNDSMVVPARVLHNWDFEPRKVCRASKQFLRLMMNKAVLAIQDTNATLFSFVEELNKIKRLREGILFMKKYFLSCKSALESKLLLQLQQRQHFVDNSNMYSLQDLCDTESGMLLTELKKIHVLFANHITSECQLCQAKGFVCELCNSPEVLFPFMSVAEVCQSCSTVLHRRCLMKKNYQCPKCQRKERRTNNNIT